MKHQKTLIQDMSEKTVIEANDRVLANYVNKGWTVAHEEYKIVYHTGDMGALSFWRFVRLEREIL